MRKAQVWSVDAILAVVMVIVAVVGFIIFSVSLSSPRKTANLVEESDILANTLGAQSSVTNISIIGDRLDERRVVQMSKLPYETLKHELGLVTDFCIYFTDRRGNLVDIGGVRFLGSPDINITVGTFTYSCNNTILGIKPQCSDTLDNDGDKLVDFTGNGTNARDPDCQSPFDDSEHP
jgi:hypothetical protein